ncbi:MAG: hypothetical protein RSE55_07710 [Lachnospiraceae bacterium]
MKKDNSSIRIKYIVVDILKSFLLGICIAISLAAICFLGGILFGHSGIISGLEVAKNALLLLASLGLFIVAGMILVKGKKAELSMKENGWRRHFKVIGFKTTAFMICTAALTMAEIFDYIRLQI